MKKILLLFLLSAMFGGCENSGTDIYAPNEQSAGKDQLSVQNASGMTINFYLEDQALNAYETTLTMEFNSAVHPFGGNIVCFTSLNTSTPTHVGWSAIEFGWTAPISAKLEIDMANVPEEDCYANVSFRGSSTSEMVIPLTKQGGGKCVAEFDWSSEFCEKLRQMFSQMGEQQLSECFITVKMGATPEPEPEPNNPISGSWERSSSTVVVTATYPVKTTMLVEYLITNTTGIKVYPLDNSFLMLTIPQGETSARAYLPDFTESQPPALIAIYRTTPKPDFNSLISGSWISASKQVVFTLKEPVPWTLDVDYLITNPTGAQVYPTDKIYVTITIPKGQTSVKAYLPDVNEVYSPPFIIRLWDVRLRSEY